ncbi:MAG: peptidoglycan editing factor PgeF [Anaerolineae bacterium]|nr:peptidoglycan editing factor PgeF [Gloeobacterales cyanobacterium ES-bin-313]
MSDWPHGFFTRSAPHREPQKLADHLQTGHAYHLKQVHSALVYSAPVDFAVEGDALWSTHDSVWVCSADCVPILFADPKTGAVAAIHAGWRGTAKSILVKTVEALQAQGSDPKDLLCAIGPCISGPAYQVSQSVADEVTATISSPEQALLPDDALDKVRLDVREVNRQQALLSGVEQISVSPICTFSEPNRLYSYRREGGGKVQYSGIGVRFS